MALFGLFAASFSGGGVGGGSSDSVQDDEDGIRTVASTSRIYFQLLQNSFSPGLFLLHRKFNP